MNSVEAGLIKVNSIEVSSIEDKVLALAGIFQSARLVQRIAQTNTVIQIPFAASIHSILVADANSTTDVFSMKSLSDIKPIQIGLEAVRDKLGGNTGVDDFEVARYVIGMIQLARKLNSDKELMEKLSSSVEEIAKDFSESGDLPESEEVDSEIIKRIAEVYTETISNLSPRIIVNGDESILKNEMATAKIRATLMAGIRAAHLWWQLGGRRWQVLFRRKQFSDAADRLLQQAD